MFEMKIVAFWVKLHSFLNLWQCSVFSVTKVFLFFTIGVYRKVFTMLFVMTICVYDFCEQVLVKENTPCQGMIDFPFQNAVFLHWLFDGTAQTHLWALKRQ